MTMPTTQPETCTAADHLKTLSAYSEGRHKISNADVGIKCRLPKDDLALPL